MSLSVALKFIYRLASRAKSDHCLTQNEMLKEIKSKVCESCHSLHCSPTHPCRASDGEKLFFFLKTHILFILIFYLCEWKPPRCLLMELSDKRKMCKLAKHVCVVQYLWRAVGAKAFMCAFIASAGPGDERGHKHLILFYFLKESSWAGGQKHVESSSREKKKEFSQDESMSGRDCHFHFRSSFLEFVQVSEHVWASPHDQNLLS